MFCIIMEQVEGIEPSSSAWKAEVIAIIRHLRIFEILNLNNMEQVEGIEPSSSAWKAEVIAIIRHLRILKY